MRTFLPQSLLCHWIIFVKSEISYFPWPVIFVGMHQGRNWNLTYPAHIGPDHTIVFQHIGAHLNLDTLSPCNIDLSLILSVFWCKRLDGQHLCQPRRHTDSNLPDSGVRHDCSWCCCYCTVAGVSHQKIQEEAKWWGLTIGKVFSRMAVWQFKPWRYSLSVCLFFKTLHFMNQIASVPTHTVL